jgi:hypothetical protein
LALLILAGAIERQLRAILFGRGLGTPGRILTIFHSIAILSKNGLLHGETQSSLRTFVDIRNRLVHGELASDDAILRAVDSGATLLAAICNIPHESHTVLNASVDVFGDSQCSSKIHNVHGVIIESAKPDRSIVVRRIFPTTRTHFETGKRVAWEWDVPGTSIQKTGSVQSHGTRPSSSSAETSMNRQPPNSSQQPTACRTLARRPSRLGQRKLARRHAARKSRLAVSAAVLQAARRSAAGT